MSFGVRACVAVALALPLAAWCADPAEPDAPAAQAPGPEQRAPTPESQPPAPSADATPPAARGGTPAAGSGPSTAPAGLNPSTAPAGPAGPAEPDAPDSPLALMPLSTVAPEIPDEVCQQRLGGWVELEYVVLPDGKVANLKVIGSEPPGAFEAAAVGAVAQWVYPPQAKPVILHQTLPLGFADCRLEQLRPADPVAVGGAGQSQEDCAAIAAQALKSGERFASAESGRAVLRGETAKVYSAPAAHCVVAGRTLKAGTRLTAHVEHNRFTLVSRGNEGESRAVWVRSRRLKDVAP